MLATALAVLQFIGTSDELWNPIDVYRQVSWLTRLILIILAAMAVRIVVVTVSRSWRYCIARRQTRQFLRSGGALSRDNRPEHVLATAKKFRRSHVATVIASGLEAYLASTSAPWSGIAAELGSSAAERTRKRIYAKMAVGRDSLSNIAAVAMYIGITGTVVNIFNAFRGNYGVSGVTGGLGFALLTTALGLIVAIPATIVYKHLQLKLAALDMEMSNASSELLTYLKAQPTPAVAIVNVLPEWRQPLSVAYDRQRLVLLPVCIVGVLVGWPIVPAAVMAFYDVVTSNPATTYGLGIYGGYYASVWSPWMLWRYWGWLSRGIVILMAILLVRVLYVVIKRSVRYRAARLATKAFVDESASAKRGFDLGTLANIALRYPQSPAAQITACAVEAFQRASGWSDGATECGWRAGERCRLLVIAELSVGLRSLASVAGVAAFTGIGGTLIGILNSFGGSAEERRTLLAGIATRLAISLITTLLGLSIAIVALVGFSYLREALGKIEIETTNVMSELVTLLGRCAGSTNYAEERDQPPPPIPPTEAAYDRHHLVLLPVWTFGVFLVCVLVWMSRWQW